MDFKQLRIFLILSIFVTYCLCIYTKNILYILIHILYYKMKCGMWAEPFPSSTGLLEQALKALHRLAYNFSDRSMGKVGRLVFISANYG